jgi:hypothetical protein
MEICPNLYNARKIKMKITYDYVYPKTCFEVEDDFFIFDDVDIYDYNSKGN